MDTARTHLAPVIQLLQWLQCFSSLGDDFKSLVTTLLQLQQLTPAQLLHAVKSYRPEVGEKGLTKAATKFLIDLQRDPNLLYQEQWKLNMEEQKKKGVSETEVPSSPTETQQQQPTSPVQQKHIPPTPETPRTPNPPTTNPLSPASVSSTRPASWTKLDMDSTSVYLDPSLTLPFSLPTSTDMLISYGAGWGGTNRERARKYIPTVPPEVLSRFDR